MYHLLPACPNFPIIIHKTPIGDQYDERILDFGVHNPRIRYRASSLVSDSNTQYPFLRLSHASFYFGGSKFLYIASFVTPRISVVPPRSEIVSNSSYSSVGGRLQYYDCNGYLFHNYLTYVFIVILNYICIISYV